MRSNYGNVLKIKLFYWHFWSTFCPLYLLRDCFWLLRLLILIYSPFILCFLQLVLHLCWSLWLRSSCDTVWIYLLQLTPHKSIKVYCTLHLSSFLLILPLFLRSLSDLFFNWLRRKNRRKLCIHQFFYIDEIDCLFLWVLRLQRAIDVLQYLSRRKLALDKMIARLDRGNSNLCLLYLCRLSNYFGL